MAPFPAGAGLAPHLGLGLPPRGLRLRQRGPRLGPLHVGSSGRATSGRGPGVVWPDEGPVMTRARALKQAIRARAAKTGERYTTARRHVLNDLCPRPVRRPAQSAAPAKAAAAPQLPKAACPTPRPREKTGHGLDHWFEVLDFRRRREGPYGLGATLERGSQHRRLVRRRHHRRVRTGPGARASIQRTSGEYEVSASKVIAAEKRDRYRGVHGGSSPAAWLAGVDAGLMPRARRGARKTRRPRRSSSERTVRDASATSGTAPPSSSTCTRNLVARCRSSSRTPGCLRPLW